MESCDLKQDYTLFVENGVLNYAPSKIGDANASLTLSKATMNEIQMGKLKLDDGINQNKVKVDGNRDSVSEFIGLMDTFPFWFNIVTP
ncbi:alkyl sulfatase C-terminal domain-containing protein [Mycolicibacterium porcinum]|uniref:Alkyl sulfatase C-terminal domain-containing protein n=1 Tax=Mycolicibacterium porcinum TaxID=39693 RepID=A0ABV3VAU4_9MYCO